MRLADNALLVLKVPSNISNLVFKHIFRHLKLYWLFPKNMMNKQVIWSICLSLMLCLYFLTAKWLRYHPPFKLVEKFELLLLLLVLNFWTTVSLPKNSKRRDKRISLSKFRHFRSFRVNYQMTNIKDHIPKFNLCPKNINLTCKNLK